MPRKTIIIFITVFILVGGAMFGFYYYKNQTTTNTTGEAPKSDYSIFNPFGSEDVETEIEGEEIETPTEDIPRGELVKEPEASQKFHKITEFAVAGATYFDDTRIIPEAVVATEVKEGGETTPPVINKTTIKATKPTAPKFEVVPSIRYVERATGHIFQMYLDTKVSGKVSNSTIPSIYEVIFDGSAKSVIYRYLSADNNSISSFIASLGSTKSEFLPSNIINIAVSPEKNRYFYITKSGSGVTGTIRSFNETKSSQVFASPYTEWIAQWVGNNKIFLTTKASSGVNGSIFSLNTANGTLSKVFGEIKGLTTLASNDGSLILYSSSLSGIPRLNVFNTKDRSVVDLNLYSLPEKCVWDIDNVTIYCAIPSNIDGSQPDNWYQGLVSFDDNFVMIDAKTGENTNIDSYSSESVDATKLFLDKNGEQIFFINKKDSTLWNLDLR